MKPLVVALQVDSFAFKHYESGVLDTDDCGGELNHYALLVGFGATDQGQEYWIVQNSWGEEWGEQGFVKIAIKDSKE